MSIDPKIAEKAAQKQIEQQAFERLNNRRAGETAELPDERRSVGQTAQVNSPYGAKPGSSFGSGAPPWSMVPVA